jgi:type IV pilus assembly protein PilY1
MANFQRRIAPHFLALALVGVASHGHAQVDVNPPRPNVLLLVDSSGSMEYKTSSTTYPTCVPTSTGSEKSRWINLIEVLAGTIPNYRCESVARNTSSFQTEFKLSGTYSAGTPNPPDYLYPLPYHRPMSGDCGPTRSTTSQDAIAYRAYSNKAACTFPSLDGGLLDAFVNQIRFGLMTFDTLTSPSTDLSGTWSYYYGSSAMGAPVGCTAESPQEVGARNAQAPLWEGRMVAFGSPLLDNEISMIKDRNTTIQNVLLATRPFGATPIAGMLDDAQDFFWTDPHPDGDTSYLGPKDDPYSKGVVTTSSSCSPTASPTSISVPSVKELIPYAARASTLAVPSRSRKTSHGRLPTTPHTHP